MKVDVRYDWMHGTYTAIMVNVVRVDAKWKAVIYDIQDDAMRIVPAELVVQWEGE